jgi:hypothetical protein
MVVRGMGWDCMDWIKLPQIRGRWKALVNMVMNLWVPQNVGTFLSNYTNGGLSRRAHLYGVNSGNSGNYPSS